MGPRDVGDGQVDVAVSVEVRGCRGPRRSRIAQVVSPGWSEDPAALVEHDQNRIQTLVGDGQIQIAVPVKVGRGHVLGFIDTLRIGDRLVEQAVPPD